MGLDASVVELVFVILTVYICSVRFLWVSDCWDDVWKPFLVRFKNGHHVCTIVLRLHSNVFSACRTAVKPVNHITVLLFLCLTCLHYSTYGLCQIDATSMFSTKRRALFVCLFVLMRALVQTALILLQQEQIQSRTVCACTDNGEPLFENTSFSS